jgi:nitroreductase
MGFLDLVRARRSVRAYLDEPVDRTLIEECLEAARLSPSACNSQPWRFIVLDDPGQKNAACDAAFTGLYSATGRFVKQAPVFVVIVTERSKYISRVGGFLKKVQYSLIDIGIAAEHFCLAATERGLGTCMLGWFNDRALKKYLKLPKSAGIDLVITVGHPKNKTARAKDRKSLDEIRTYNDV